MTTTAEQPAGWEPDLAHFGARLALVRQRMGWGNVKEAADACGLPVSSWRNWERDGRQPRDYMAACSRIAERTGVSLQWLALGPRPGAPRPPLRGESNNVTYRSLVRATAARRVIGNTHDHEAAARAA